MGFTRPQHSLYYTIRFSNYSAVIMQHNQNHSRMFKTEVTALLSVPNRSRDSLFPNFPSLVPSLTVDGVQLFVCAVSTKNVAPALALSSSCWPTSVARAFDRDRTR